MLYIYISKLRLILFDFRFALFIFSNILETGQYYKNMNKKEISYKSNSLHNQIKNSEPKTVSKTLNNDLKEINKILIYPDILYICVCVRSAYHEAKLISMVLNN